MTNLGGVDLSWSPPLTSTYPIASYEFRYQSDTGSGFGGFTAWTTTGTGTGTSFTHICAVGNVNTTCRYEVRAIDTQSSTSVPEQSGDRGRVDRPRCPDGHGHHADPQLGGTVHHPDLGGYRR